MTDKDKIKKLEKTIKNLKLKLKKVRQEASDLRWRNNCREWTDATGCTPRYDQ